MVDGMKWKFLSFFILKRGEKVPCCKSQISDMKRKKNLLIWVSVFGRLTENSCINNYFKKLMFIFLAIFLIKMSIYRKYNDFDPQITSIQHEHSFQMPYYNCG